MTHPSQNPVLTLRAITAVGVEVPMTYVLGTSRGAISKAPLLLIDVTTEEGVTGRAYLWSYFRHAMPAIASILRAVEDTTRGERVAPEALWDKLTQRFALIGVQGIVRMAMAGFDVACWDAVATGQQDYLAAAPSVIPAVKKANPSRDIEIKFVMKSFPYGVGLRKEDVALKGWVDEWIKTNLKNGKFNEIYKRHFGMSLPEEMLK